MKKRDKNQERIDRIRAIHDEFMAELNKVQKKVKPSKNKKK
jgi:hypothetical protein